MRQRKFGFLLVALMVGFGLLFTSGEARAATLNYGIAFDGISSDSNYKTDATYTYTLTNSSGSVLDYIDIGIPIEINLESPSNYGVVLTGATPGSITVFAAGEGDLGTKFGVADTRIRVMKINLSPTGDAFTIALTLREQIFNDSLKKFDSDPQGVVVIKAGNGQNTQSFLTKTPMVGVDSPALVQPSLTVAPTAINFGECPEPTITLTWEISGAQFAFISNINSNGGVVDPSDGSLPLALVDCPLETTTYKLTTIGYNGEIKSDDATLIVHPPPPPVGIDAEYISVEGHPDYSMQINKDVYGNLREICLVTNPGHTQVGEECATGAGPVVIDVNGGITLDLGNLGSSVILCRSGEPGNPDNPPDDCDYFKFSSKETEGKSGEATCGWKFFFGRYAYICF